MFMSGIAILFCGCLPFLGLGFLRGGGGASSISSGGGTIGL